jgi:hypothetical protein
VYVLETRRIGVMERRWGKGGKHVLSQPWWQLHIFKKPMSTVGSGAVKPDELHPALDRIPVATGLSAR